MNDRLIICFFICVIRPKPEGDEKIIQMQALKVKYIKFKLFVTL